MLHATLPTIQRSRITQGVVTIVLVLAVLAASVASIASVPSASRVSAEAPAAQNVIMVEATNLDAAAGSAVESSSGRLYAIIEDGFYLSTNGGDSWTRQTTSSAPYLSPASFAVDPGNPLIVYLGTDYDGLFKSVDGGATFLHSSTGLGAGSEVAVTAIYLPVSHPGLLMATTANWSGADQGNLVPQGLYVSTNKGQSWFKVSDAAGASSITSLDLDSEMVVTAQSTDGALQRIRLESALSAGLMQYGVPEARRQVPLAMAFLGMEAGELELNRRFLTGEDLPATISSLALLGTPSAIKTLVSALADTRESARWHLSMQSLEYLGEKAVPALITGLSDDDAMLRANAAELLGWIGSATAVPALELALTDADQAVREAAAWALGEIR
jgi:hypothetical protein